MEQEASPKGSYFAISEGKGFHMQFANGWCISVQFGWGNYCENKSKREIADRELGRKGCANAEVAVFDPNDDMVTLPGFMFGGGEPNVVSGWNDANKVLELMNWTASQPSSLSS